MRARRDDDGGTDLAVRTAELRAAGFVDLPLHPAIGARARAVQAMLARRSRHRGAGVVDLITAAVAEHYGAIVCTMTATSSTSPP